MKIPTLVRFPLLLLALVLLGTGCSSAPRKAPADPAPAAVGAKADGKAVAADDLDEYATSGAVSDPIEPVNRATFWLNHQLYRYLLKPIAKGYEFIIPKPVRRGVANAFENVRYPVRVVNDTLQGNFHRAGLETGKFFVNTVIGVGGVMRASDRFPALADVPAGDTGQTFAKWGIGPGPYVVLPVLGPSTVRDTFGLAGDYALNPINWVTIWFGGYTWTLAIPSANSLRSLPDQMNQYDAATQNSLDRYLAARSAYMQYREERKAAALR